MSKLLKNVGVHIVCEHCETEFDTTAEVVAKSQQLLDDGCPGESHECPARLFANFVDRQALRDLAEAWERVRKSVHAPAVDIELASQPTVERAVEPPVDDDPDGSEEAGGSDGSFSPSPGAVTFTLQRGSKPSNQETN